jgi:putative DNA primase/helicase
VRAYGVRLLPGEVLAVPMRAEAGELVNLQRIAARPPTPEEEAKGAREKRYLPSARKKGARHWLGDPAAEQLRAAAAAAGADGSSAVLCLAEGYATAASCHEATGWPVAVCFDSGNLVEVARTLPELLPGAAFLVLTDDDAATAARTDGKNPGRVAAAAAVRALRKAGARAWAACPTGHLEGTNADFNDMHQAQGLDVVRAALQTACAELLGEEAQTSRTGAESGQVNRTASQGQPAPAQAPEQPPAALGPAEPSPQRDPFMVNAQGVWFIARDNEGNAKPPQWVCAPIEVTARTRNEEGNGWGFLLSFADPDGRAKSWAMPSALLSGDGSEWAARLRDMGLRIAPGTRRNLLQQYLDTRQPSQRVTCTDRVGWHGAAYVLPSATVGDAEGGRFVFQSDSGMDDTFRQRGELAEWQREVAALCVGNTRMVFAVCVALAGPLLRLAGMESGGIHLLGDSSAGKSTALRLAASVWGRPNFMQSWRSTANALEATAAQHSDCTLILDELGQLDGREAGEVAYMLANDQEKGRDQRTGLLRKRRTWRLLFLSSGELSLADHMAEAGKRTRAGQEVRMVAVPMDAGAGMGGLERLHHCATPQELAEAMTAAAARLHGTAGRAWLAWLSEWLRCWSESRAACCPRGPLLRWPACAAALPSWQRLASWPHKPALPAGPRARRAGPPSPALRHGWPRVAT